MTEGHVFIATSLDGFIARLDGGIDWLQSANAAGEDHGYDQFVSNMDGIVMGRATLNVSLGFNPWPFSKPIIVLSSTLSVADLPKERRDQISISRSVADAREQAAEKGWKRAYIDGGVTIRAFLREGAIRDMTLTRIPVLLGDGLPLFGPIPQDVYLKHVGTRNFPSGLVQSRYEVL